jgi:hypothetical protein
VPDFTTAAEVKEYLGITGSAQDAFLADLVSRVTSLLQGHLGRKIVSGAETEYHDGSDRPGITLRQYPVTTFTSLHQSQDQVWDSTTLLAASDYIVDLARARVWLKGGYFNHGWQNIKAVYTAGYATVPPALEHFAIESCARIFKRRDNPDVVSWSLKDGAVAKRIIGDMFSEFAHDLAPWTARQVV